MDRKQLSMFKEWFADAFPDCKDYLELTYFDAEQNTFLSKCSYNPDSGNAAKVLRTVLGSWQHQQAKVEELQHRNQMLNDNIKEQGQKLVYQNEVIEKQAEKLLGLRDEKAELQKQVDAALKKLDKRRDELWSKWKWQADMQDQGAANAFEEAYWILEQALKGEGL
ncbi:hypothetical protein [Acinetobacter nosocomialis]|uniref:hypothetical protein n=1 Tax=Acinetobacter nosocomialis TaxID=106654 RepID=UPI000A32F094|nr:hypothetical protein [Acinetobacter nosocomialis]OTL05388.1 hypothetical protein B9X83_03300 [Acinetobacter nosocomialis]